MNNQIDENKVDFYSQASLESMTERLNYYQRILDQDQQVCANLIASIRKEIGTIDEKKHFDRLIVEWNNQVDYYEQQMLATINENRKCKIVLTKCK